MDVPNLPEGITLQVDDPEALNDPKVLDLIHQMVEGLDENPLNKFFPHPKQHLFMSAKTKTKLFVGGNRSGKSTSWVLYVIINCIDKALVPEHLLQYRIWDEPIKVRVVTPDYGRSFKSVMEVFSMWTPEAQLRGASWESGFNERAKELHFSNGSFIEFMTLEQDVNKFGGSPRHVVIFDEEPKGEKGEEIWRQCVMRLADYRGEELFAFTPLEGLSWTYDEYWESRGPEIAEEVWQDPATTFVKASIHDNPNIDEEGRRESLAKLPEKVRAAYESGDFTHFQGLVYDNFDLNLHLEERDIVPKDLHHPDPDKRLVLDFYEAIDPGQATLAILFAGFEAIEDELNILHIFDELTLSGTQAIPENAAPLIKSKRAYWGIPERTVKHTKIDPSAVSRSLTDGRRIDMAWREAGIKTAKADNDVFAGVSEVWRRMEHVDSRGTPRSLIKISSRCKNLLREKGKYRLAPKEDGTFGVVKKNDHHSDCERYIAMAKPLDKKKRKPHRAKLAWIPGTAPAQTRPKRQLVLD